MLILPEMVKIAYGIEPPCVSYPYFEAGIHPYGQRTWISACAEMPGGQKVLFLAFCSFA